MVWLEVECKVKLEDSQVSVLRKRIKEIAKFNKRGTKKDDYFAIQKHGFPKKAFRIRQTKEQIEVCFKKKVKNLYSKDVVVKQEFEFVLKGKNDVDDLLALFTDMGFTEWVKKIKRNETYKYNKNKKLSIEINHVKNLGYFMEMEYLCQEPEAEKAKDLIRSVLEELKIDINQIDNTGYTKMLWYKGTLGKHKFIDGKFKETAL
jgi:predicted adenylyl cyclase CyaB